MRWAGLLFVVLGLAVDSAEAQFQYKADGVSVPAASADEPVIKLSIKKASEHLEDGALAWGKQRRCVSCHTNGSYLFVRPALTKLLGKPTESIREFFVDQLTAFKKTDPDKLRKASTKPAQVVYIAAGLAEWDAHVTGKLSKETDKALRLMFGLQDETGTWHSLTCWPPFESSAYQEAHMAAMAIAAAPGWLDGLKQDDAVRKNVDRLKTYIRETQPPHDYARVLKLWTALRLDGILNEKDQQATAALIRGKQQTDGGWSIRHFAKPEEWGGGNRAEKIRNETDFKAPPSDGHMTGLALLVLQEAGINAKDKQIQRGLKWLRENQRESGRWWTRSLNTDRWHFITYNGTAYSLLALSRSE